MRSGEISKGILRDSADVEEYDLHKLKGGDCATYGDGEGHIRVGAQDWLTGRTDVFVTRLRYHDGLQKDEVVEVLIR